MKKRTTGPDDAELSDPVTPGKDKEELDSTCDVTLLRTKLAEAKAQLQTSRATTSLELQVQLEKQRVTVLTGELTRLVQCLFSSEKLDGPFFFFSFFFFFFAPFKMCSTERTIEYSCLVADIHGLRDGKPLHVCVVTRLLSTC